MLKYLRFILFPFSLIYYVITSLRNKLYDWKVLKSFTFNTPIICIGNISTGGTGKTPHTEYFIKLFENKKIVVLSRGYGRKTKGLLVGNNNSTEQDIGDEPYQIMKNNPHITMVVCEDRKTGIEFIERELKPELIIMDDGFQHRRVQPDFNVILTDYNRPLYKDFILPMGNLRESRYNANRGNMTIVTKCPNNLSTQEKDTIKTSLERYTDKPLFFSQIQYKNISNINNDEFDLSLLLNKKVLLITGISNPKPLEKHLQDNSINFTHKEYSDHHNFSDKEISSIKEKFTSEKFDYILTTQKDFTRIKDKFDSKYLLYIPIKVEVMDFKANDYFSFL